MHVNVFQGHSSLWLVSPQKIYILFVQLILKFSILILLIGYLFVCLYLCNHVHMYVYLCMYLCLCVSMCVFIEVNN